MSAQVISGPFSNFTLTKEDRAICSSHQQDLSQVFLEAGLFGIYDLSFACPMCKASKEMNNYFEATFKAYGRNGCCVISSSLSQDLSEHKPIHINPTLSFNNHVIEHELLDRKSDGYGLNSLVYMKDRETLAACSKNGSICFWSVGGEKVELKEPKLNLEKKINFAKYDGKTYFAVGTDKGVYIYRVAGDISSICLLGVIDVENIVTDLDFLQEEERKIVAVYNDSTAKIWSLNTQMLERTIDLQQYGITEKIYTVIYLKATDELAIEHAGLSIIKNWQQKAGEMRHHLVEYKDGFGCKYLPNTRTFLMNNGSKGIQHLGEVNFEERSCFLPKSTSEQTTNPVKKFITSQDEFVFISTASATRLRFFGIFACVDLRVSHNFQGIADIEIMEDHYRIAIANDRTGVVTIYRTNANVNIERNSENGQLLRAVKNEIQPISSRNSTFGSGNLVSRRKKANVSSGKSQKEQRKLKPKQASKPAKKGKKIQKIQMRSNATREKVSQSVKRELIKKAKKVEEEKESIIEAVRIKGKKKTTKEEKVWMVLPSEDEKKRGRSLMKKKDKKEAKRKGEANEISEDRSRSRSKSKSVTRKK